MAAKRMPTASAMDMSDITRPYNRPVSRKEAVSIFFLSDIKIHVE